MTLDGRARAPFAVLLWLAACGGGGPEAPDPCAAVGVCSTPPADACASGSTTRALRYPATGTCAAVAGSASCDYQPALVDCALDGRVCLAGACVAPPDPCAEPGACTTPPADACATAELLLRYVDPAACTAQGGAASCHYPPTQVDCAAAGQACQDGACVAPPDPCDAPDACTSPPPAGCASATVRVDFGTPASCTSPSGLPECQYPATTTDCAAAGQVCQGGACVAPPPCQVSGVCTTPPADGCLTPTTAQRYLDPGTCTEVGGAATCLYQPAEVDCGATDLACLDGACVDPCAAPGACTAPPADDCASATVRLDYGSPGACSHPGGLPSCSYAPAVVDCAATGQVCQGGACVAPPDPCAEPGACTTPPPDECASARTLLRYPAAGGCTNAAGVASCDYPPAQITCPAGQVCAGGACVTDPCALPLDGAGFLAYAAWLDGAAGYELRAMRVDGTCDQHLAGGPGDDLEPSWSAASGRLAWGATREGIGRIVVMDLSDRLEQVLDTGLDLASSPALTADAQELVYESRAFAAPSSDLRVIAAAGGAGRPLFASAAELEAGPAISHDGAAVYFVSSRLGRLGIWKGSLGGGDQTLVTFADDLLGKPAVSPDGRYLAWARSSSTAGSLSQVVLHDLATHAERVVSDHGDSEPAFPAAGVRLDGKELLAVRTTRYGLTDLVLLDLETGQVVRRLTDGARLVGTPAFPR